LIEKTGLGSSRPVFLIDLKKYSNIVIIKVLVRLTAFNHFTLFTGVSSL